MLAVQPYVLVTMQQGEETRRLETETCAMYTPGMTKDTELDEGSRHWAVSCKTLVLVSPGRTTDTGGKRSRNWAVSH